MVCSSLCSIIQQSHGILLKFDFIPLILHPRVWISSCLNPTHHLDKRFITSVLKFLLKTVTLKFSILTTWVYNLQVFGIPSHTTSDPLVHVPLTQENNSVVLSFVLTHSQYKPWRNSIRKAGEDGENRPHAHTGQLGQERYLPRLPYSSSAKRMKPGNNCFVLGLVFSCWGNLLLGNRGRTMSWEGESINLWHWS